MGGGLQSIDGGLIEQLLVDDVETVTGDDVESRVRSVDEGRALRGDYDVGDQRILGVDARRSVRRRDDRRPQLQEALQAGRPSQ